MVIILGLGFTGTRLARSLLSRGIEVFAPVRGINRFRELAKAGLQLSELRLDKPEAMLLPRHSIMVVLVPPLPDPGNSALREIILKLAPKRVVYVSSTGVYGDQIEVDRDTPAIPSDDRGRLRLDEEHWISSGPWTSLILRAAAIYGPGRGVHAALREGKLPRGVRSGIVSRIHVDDLARIIEAGMFSDVEGPWPVADEEPCSTAEIRSWCAKLLQLEGAADYGMNPFAERPLLGRIVDGTKIRELLHIELKYPSWQSGIEASIAEENNTEKENRNEPN